MTSRNEWKPGIGNFYVSDTVSLEDFLMRYMAAWLLGVPGIVIVLWFLFAHLPLNFASHAEF